MSLLTARRVSSPKLHPLTPSNRPSRPFGEGILEAEIGCHASEFDALSVTFTDEPAFDLSVLPDLCPTHCTRCDELLMSHEKGGVCALCVADIEDEAKAEAMGYRAGRDGLTPTPSQSRAYHEYMDGYRRGKDRRREIDAAYDCGYVAARESGSPVAAPAEYDAEMAEAFAAGVEVYGVEWAAEIAERDLMAEADAEMSGVRD
jgi:hypothetical protein